MERIIITRKPRKNSNKVEPHSTVRKMLAYGPMTFRNDDPNPVYVRFEFTAY